MLHSMNGLHGMKIIAMDGDIGSIDDAYFDDKDRLIRLLVALRRSKRIDWLGRSMAVNPTRAKIEHNLESDPDYPSQTEDDFFRRSSVETRRP